MLEQLGLLEGRHYELIDGEFIDKMGKLRPHVGGVHLTAEALEAIFGKDRVNREAPIDVALSDNSTNEPEPDVIAFRCPWRGFTANPQPSDVALLVEVADSTIRHDTTTKAGLYARAGIVEYWVLDLNRRRLMVFRDSDGQAYQTRLEFDETQSICPLERPSNSVAVASLIP